MFYENGTITNDIYTSAYPIEYWILYTGFMNFTSNVTTLDGAGEVEFPVLYAHYVPVISVTSSKDGCLPMPTVGKGFSAKMSVTVANQGNYTETFNVTVYANALALQTQTVTLASQNFTTLTFTWDTTGLAYGNYTLSAYAWPVPGETNTANNNMTGSTIFVTVPMLVQQAQRFSLCFPPVLWM